jgi:hypothetical protein
VLVHPRCARDRAEDLDEVKAMIEAEEFEIAVDELRWLVSGCSEFISAHCLLGQLAVVPASDIPLARGHYGFAYQLGIRVLRRAGNPRPLLCRHPANHDFFLAGRGLAWCLAKLQKMDMAREVVATLLELDPSDPLELKAMLEGIAESGEGRVES